MVAKEAALDNIAVPRDLDIESTFTLTWSELLTIQLLYLNLLYNMQ